MIASERQHIEDRLGYPALVSLTDHDTFDGPRRLMAEGRDEVPLSIEWSVPFDSTVFHLGVHGVPAARADETERVLTAFTTSGEGDLDEICDWLLEWPETFIVLNHPYWDMSRRGSLRHDATLLAFLRRHRHRVHALELNGYRSWAENRRVLPLAEGFGLPVVGGGDRHGLSPNTIVNLTAATSLAEFARDLRAGRSTYCVIFPEYLQPFRARLVQGTSECLSPVGGEDGRTLSWTDRVFATIDGVDTPLSAIWTGAPFWLRGVIGLTQVLASPALHPLFEVTDLDTRRELASDLSADLSADLVFAAVALQRRSVNQGARVRDSWSGVIP